MNWIDIIVTLAVLISGLVLSVYFERKAKKDAAKAKKKEIDRLLDFDESDIYS